MPLSKGAVDMMREEEVRQESPASVWTKVEAVVEGGAFAAMRAEWQALEEASAAGIFNTWEWLYPWFRRVAPERSLRILTARNRHGELLGLMPLGLETRWMWGRKVRRLAFLGETHVGSDGLDVMARRGLEEAVARAFATHLRLHSAFWDVLDLKDLLETSPTLGVLRDVFNEGFVHQMTARFVCPYETLASESFDDFLRRTGRRDNYLRRRKWLEKQPGYRIQKHEAPLGLAPSMGHFLRLHALRWKEDGGSQGINGPSVEAFHRDAAQWLAERQKLRMYTLMLGEQALGSVYGLMHQKTFLYYQSGYDPAWRNKSVGLVLVGETFKDSLEAGFQSYDFLRGTEGYKSEWTTKQRRTVAFRAYTQSARGRWFSLGERFEKSVRDTAKVLLPGGIVETIRRFRRRRAAH